jgi:signal transduction histidine kinase
MPMPDVTRAQPRHVTGTHSGVPAAQAAVDILVVDDNPGKLLALETVLAPLGQNVITARSGNEALRHLLSRDFATVILDVNMPGLDGFETAQMVRSRPRSASTPIIFISAVNMDEADASRGYSLGAVDYIFAPVIPEVLRAKVSVFVELHRKSEEARIQAERLQQRTRELEQSQRQLRLSERMASIGTLCAGLGHDMGNLLLPISVWIDTIDPHELPQNLQDGVQNLSTCVQYLRKLASGLRLMSLDPSRETGHRHVVLSQWLAEVAPILRNALPRGVSLEIDIPEGLPPVRISPHRLAQAVFNLVQNAGEVLHGRKEALVRFWARRETADAGVRIGVSDNGPGMSREVMDRCLEPFFTTKTRGISTGLGLSLVHGITQAAGATLEVASSPERGTTFSFVLPVAEDTPSVQASAIVTIDDSRMRALAAALVQGAGCEIVSDLPESHASAAVWVTDRVVDLENRAAQFRLGRSNRRVFLLAEEVGDVGEIRTVQITGPRALGVELRRFMTQLSAECSNIALSAC